MALESTDVVVVGGGLGGLSAAALVARRGLSVVVLERAAELGGRGATHVYEGFHFNLGAHALYLGGAAARVLGTLGARFQGRAPPSGGLAVHGDRVHALPSTFGGLLRTGLLGFRAKLEAARFMTSLDGIDDAVLAATTLSSWLDERVSDATLSGMLQSFVRVATYSHAPDAMSAGAAVAQLRLAQRPGVVYVDGGWATLVASVDAVARAAGADVRTAASVTSAEPLSGGRGFRVAVEGGETLSCRALVLATGPSSARSIVAKGALAAWSRETVPVKTACLDVALSRLPREGATFALGVDRPLYLSVHSRTAAVAPRGAALVSTMKYLAPGEPQDATRDRAELEAWLDTLQPGWREVLVERRWLPQMVATNALIRARDGGLPRRPGPAVPDVDGLFVVGDWVGQEGMLLDASMASAERAASEIGEMLGARRSPAEATSLRVA